MDHYEASIMQAAPPNPLTHAALHMPTTSTADITANLSPNLSLPPVGDELTFPVVATATAPSAAAPSTNVSHVRSSATRMDLDKYVPLPDGVMAKVDTTKSYVCSYPDCGRVCYKCRMYICMSFICVYIVDMYVYPVRRRRW